MRDKRRARAVQQGPRIVLYYQTHFIDGELVRTSEAVKRVPGVSAIILSAVHLEDDGLTLNDYEPDDPLFDGMWADLHLVQTLGTPVLAMLGGAAQGSYRRLDGETLDEEHYGRLVAFLRDHRLDGVDLDVEEDMSLEGIIRLAKRLKADFGDDFILTMAPVDTALRGGQNLSGFSYPEFFAAEGDVIDWVNVQFYCSKNRGTLENGAAYAQIVETGILPPRKLVAGTITHPMHCHGYVPIADLCNTYRTLATRYPDFGGASAWEYFNSEPGGVARPWEWSERVSAAFGEAEASVLAEETGGITDV